MEQPIIVKNHYTLQTFTDFANFHCKKIQGIGYFRYLGFLMIVATMWFFINSPTLNLFNLVFNPGIILSLLFIGMSYWIPGNTAKQLYRKCKENDGLTNTITFDNLKVVFTSINVETVYFYKQLYKCYETEKYFYVYVRRSTAQIICKADCNNDDVLILRKFLQHEPNIKFIDKTCSKTAIQQKTA